MRPIAQLAICSLRLLARRPPSNHGDPRAVAVGGAIEHIDETAMTRQRLRPAARMKIELRKNMAAQARQMNVDPVVAPIDQIGTKRMVLRVSRLQRRIECTNVACVKSINELLDVWAIDL